MARIIDRNENRAAWFRVQLPRIDVAVVSYMLSSKTHINMPVKCSQNIRDRAIIGDVALETPE
jgi:hypothetical protein